MSFHPVCRPDDIELGRGREFMVAGLVLAIFRLPAKQGEPDMFLAVDGMCAHQGGPIAQGQVDRTCVTCPWHGWQYDLRDGTNLLTGKHMLACYPTKLDDGQVWVSVS